MSSLKYKFVIIVFCIFFYFCSTKICNVLFKVKKKKKEITKKTYPSLVVIYVICKRVFSVFLFSCYLIIIIIIIVKSNTDCTTIQILFIYYFFCSNMMEKKHISNFVINLKKNEFNYLPKLHFFLPLTFMMIMYL